jgi:hypothetical protein
VTGDEEIKTYVLQMLAIKVLLQQQKFTVLLYSMYFELSDIVANTELSRLFS